jgi:hypothetical protein
MVRKHIWKCLSLSLSAFLIAAWMANFFGQFGVGTRWGKFDQHFSFRSGSLSISQHRNGMLQGLFWRTYPKYVPEKYGGAVDASSLSARLRFKNPGKGHWDVEVPIILLITAMIPVVAWSFCRFRFRLWQCFAFTAIVAIELAFFLRT